MAELYKGYLKIALMFEDQQLHSRGMRPKEDDDEEDGKKKKKAKKKKKETETNGIIHLHIKEGSDLPSADKDGLSDPFCKWWVEALRLLVKAKFKTLTNSIAEKEAIYNTGLLLNNSASSSSNLKIFKVHQKRRKKLV